MFRDFLRPSAGGPHHRACSDGGRRGGHEWDDMHVEEDRTTKAACQEGHQLLRRRDKRKEIRTLRVCMAFIVLKSRSIHRHLGTMVVRMIGTNVYHGAPDDGKRLASFTMNITIKRALATFSDLRGRRQNGWVRDWSGACHAATRSRQNHVT